MGDMDAAERADYYQRALGLSPRALADSMDALRDLGPNLSTALQTFASMRGYWDEALSLAERARCYRAYAARLNLTRPWRKVSWRRLNRPQRAEAARLWLAWASAVKDKAHV